MKQFLIEMFGLFALHLAAFGLIIGSVLVIVAGIVLLGIWWHSVDPY